jgi:hypothetical protein
LEPRTTTLPVTFRVDSLRALGPPGSERGWVAADRRGRHYELTIGDVEDTKMTARIRHGDGDRRLLAYADLAPFVEALFDQLAALLERPVFACCDSPQPDPAGTCQACGAELTDDQLRALVGCTHPTVADIPAGEWSPCPDCGLVWAMAAINVQHHELPDGRTFASFADSDVEPCERRATGARRDGRTFCTAHQAGGDVLIVTPAEGW